MENNWPETMDELPEECKRLSSKYDLFQLGELNRYPDWPDGTENLSGEWQYGVAMIPAAWVLRVAATLGAPMLIAEQVSNAVYAHSIHADCADADWQAIADELNERLRGKAVG